MIRCIYKMWVDDWSGGYDQDFDWPCAKYRGEARGVLLLPRVPKIGEYVEISHNVWIEVKFVRTLLLPRAGMGISAGDLLLNLHRVNIGIDNESDAIDDGNNTDLRYIKPFDYFFSGMDKRDDPVIETEKVIVWQGNIKPRNWDRSAFYESLKTKIAEIEKSKKKEKSWNRVMKEKVTGVFDDALDVWCNLPYCKKNDFVLELHNISIPNALKGPGGFLIKNNLKRYVKSDVIADGKVAGYYFHLMSKISGEVVGYIIVTIAKEGKVFYILRKDYVEGVEYYKDRNQLYKGLKIYDKKLGVIRN